MYRRGRQPLFTRGSDKQNAVFLTVVGQHFFSTIIGSKADELVSRFQYRATAGINTQNPILAAGGLAFHHNGRDAGFAESVRRAATHIGLLDAAGQRAFGTDGDPAGIDQFGAGEQSAGKHQFIVGPQRIAAGRYLDVDQGRSQSPAA